MNRFFNRNQDRFDNYRECEARYASKASKCGHEVKIGDVIGVHKIHGVLCASCWAKWVAENEEADQLERQFEYQSRDCEGFDSW